MIGDGINDAPALSTGLQYSKLLLYRLTSCSADVGIAMGSGSDIAITNAKFILISSSLMSILTLMELSQTVLRRIKFNILW